jgi:8-oxo-dGTP pyrophosphatase MutT (NUDIX family)
LPSWLRPVAELADRITAADLAWPISPRDGDRDSAILLLFGEQDGVPDLLLIERAHTLRSHAGQPAFPGGALDPTDAGPVEAALREAEEETGLDPAGVEVFGQLPVVHVRPSGYAVTPVLGWWRTPSPVRVVDPSEVASVHRVPLDNLLDPANRFQVRHSSGYVGPAFGVAGLVVWGFTGGLLSRLLTLLGWDRPWDQTRVRDLAEAMVELALPSAREASERRAR